MGGYGAALQRRTALAITCVAGYGDGVCRQQVLVARYIDEERQGWKFCETQSGAEDEPHANWGTEGREGQRANAGRMEPHHIEHTEHRYLTTQAGRRRIVEGEVECEPHISWDRREEGVPVSAGKNGDAESGAHVDNNDGREIMDVVVHTAGCNMWTTGIHDIHSGAWTWCGRLRERSPAPGVWLDDWCWHVQRG